MPAHLLPKVEACYQLAERHFSRCFPRPDVSFALRGKVAGVAHLQSNRLRFNPNIYQDNREHFLLQTVPHEVAHLLVYHLYGPAPKPHGTEWQTIMTQLFQRPAQRCHSYQVPPVWKTLYAYACQCQQHDISPQRHARVQRGYQYLCRRCRTELQFTGHVQRKLVER